LIKELKHASLEKITLQEIVGHQLMQKVHFVERHMQDNELNAGVVKNKRELLTQIWKAELQDPSRIRAHYEK
jgi:hypothetical protein